MDGAEAPWTSLYDFDIKMVNWLELQNQILMAVGLLWMQSRLLYGKKYKLQLSHWKAS